MSQNMKEYFFLIYLKLIKTKKDEVNFKSKENNEETPKCILTKQFKSKENNEIIKVFKFMCEPKKEESFEFSFDNENFKVILKNLEEQTFIFETTLNNTNIFNIINYYEKIDQNKIDISDKMNYYLESLKETKETDKLDILFTDSIKLYTKRPNFKFLVNIFIHIYNTNLCSNLINEFRKNIDNPEQKDSIIEKGLDKYNNYFEDICEISEDLISSNSLDKIDFYGLILCYLNNFLIKKFNEQFKKLYKKDKYILFEIILKYKSYFKNEFSLDTDIVDEIVRFSTTKDFKEFKNCEFYLKDINTFLDAIEKKK